MKKLIALILSAVMVFGAVSCGSSDNGGDSAVKSIDELSTETIIDLFTDMTDLQLRSSCVIQPLEPDMVGYMIGYESFAGEFESATSLAPMMTSIPFVLVVFRLNEGADAAAFAADLKANANPNKWVCVTADSVETRVSGRTVMFLMCPADMTEPLTTAFTTMTTADFNPADHLIQPLKDITMNDLYTKLLEMYSAENGGFLDNKDTVAASDNKDFGTDKLDSKLYTDSLVDSGSVKSEYMNGSYKLAMFCLSDKTTSEDFIKALRENLTVDAEENSIIAFTDDVVILFAGSGDLGNYAIDLRYLFMNEYRAEITGFVVLD